MSHPQISTDQAVMRSHSVDTPKVPSDCPPLTVRCFGLTDPGMVRDANEDHFLIAGLVKALQIEQTSLPQAPFYHSNDRSYLFLVADGVGGTAAGAQASALAIGSVESFILETFKWFAQCKGRDHNQVLADFQNALGQANARVLAEAKEHPAWRGMGTTLTLAYSLNDELFVAHAGDSRCYLFREAILYRLTRDHTLVEDMVRAGTLPAEEAAHHHWRHVITNAVGGNSPEVIVEVHKVHLESGDGLLLCTDGLTEMLSEEIISRILQTEREPEQACRRLVAEANQAGGRDNVTAIVAHFHASSRPALGGVCLSAATNGNGQANHSEEPVVLTVVP